MQDGVADFAELDDLVGGGAFDGVGADRRHVPGGAVALFLPADLGEAGVGGAPVVRIRNFDTFDGLTVAADGSAASEVAAAPPQSRVLKAFNTNFAGTLQAGSVGGQTTTVLIAGAGAAGLQAVDVGSLKRARELEALRFLQLTLAAGEKVAWTRRRR